MPWNLRARRERSVSTLDAIEVSRIDKFKWEGHAAECNLAEGHKQFWSDTRERKGELSGDHLLKESEETLWR